MINIQRSGLTPGITRKDEVITNPIERLKSGDFGKIFSASMAQKETVSPNTQALYNQQLSNYNQYWAGLTGNTANAPYAQQAYAAPAYNYAQTYIPAYTPVNQTSYADQPYALLGKTVTANAQAYNSDGTATTQQITGVVQGVYLENGQTYLSVNGYRVKPSDVLSVDGSAVSSAVAGTSSASPNAPQAGQTVSASCRDANGNEYIVEGVVSRVFESSGKTYATVNGLDIDVKNIHAILPSAGTGTNSVSYGRAAGLPYSSTQSYSPYGLQPTARQLQALKSTPPDPDIAGIEIGTGTIRSPMPDTIARTASYGANFSSSLTGSGSANYYNAGMSQLLQWIQNDPGLLSDGEFEIFGTPDENGAYG